MKCNPFFHRENLEKTLDETFVESAVRDLKQPIIARPIHGARSRYQVAFGHRRWQAFKVRRLLIPCVLRRLTDEKMVDYAWDDTFQYEAHAPREEAKLIVTRLDWKLRHCSEYENYGRDPLAVLRAMEFQRTRKVAKAGELGTRRRVPKSGKGRPPTGKYPVPESLCKTVEGVFSELPERRRIDWSTFVRSYLSLLDIPADVQEALDAKGISGSVGVMAAIARLEDPFARKLVLKWAKKRKRIPVRIIDKRVHVLNKCRDELEQLSSKPQLKKQLIELVLDKCPHPADVRLEAKRLLADTSQRPTAKQKQEISTGVFYGLGGGGDIWSRMNQDQLEQYGLHYDREVLEALKDAPIKLLHVCSTKNQEDPQRNGGLMESGWFKQYPVNAINWWDANFTPLSIAKKTYGDKFCIVCGIDHDSTMRNGTPKQVEDQVKAAIESAGEGGFMMAPGCTLFQDTPLENFNAVGRAVEEYGRCKQ